MTMIALTIMEKKGEMLNELMNKANTINLPPFLKI